MFQKCGFYLYLLVIRFDVIYNKESIYVSYLFNKSVFTYKYFQGSHQCLFALKISQLNPNHLEILRRELFSHQKYCITCCVFYMPLRNPLCETEIDCFLFYFFFSFFYIYRYLLINSLSSNTHNLHFVKLIKKKKSFLTYIFMGWCGIILFSI